MSSVCSRPMVIRKISSKGEACKVVLRAYIQSTPIIYNVCHNHNCFPSTPGEMISQTQIQTVTPT